MTAGKDAGALGALGALSGGPRAALVGGRRARERNHRGPGGLLSLRALPRHAGRPVGECVDGVEATFERRQPQLIELLVIHTRGPEITDDLVDAGGLLDLPHRVDDPGMAA